MLIMNVTTDNSEEKPPTKIQFLYTLPLWCIKIVFVA